MRKDKIEFEIVENYQGKLVPMMKKLCYYCNKRVDFKKVGRGLKCPMIATRFDVQVTIILSRANLGMI